MELHEVVLGFVGMQSVVVYVNADVLVAHQTVCRRTCIWLIFSLTPRLLLLLLMTDFVTSCCEALAIQSPVVTHQHS